MKYKSGGISSVFEFLSNISEASGLILSTIKTNNKQSTDICYNMYNQEMLYFV